MMIRDANGYPDYLASCPDDRLDPPAETTDELGTEDRCDACGGELCPDCDGCTEGDPEGCAVLCSCPSPVGIPDERWDAELERVDGEVDDAKVAEREKEAS